MPETRLKAILRERKCSLRRLAGLTRLSTATIHAIAAYDVPSKRETKERIATALGLEVTDIWTGEGTGRAALAAKPETARTASLAAG